MVAKVLSMKCIVHNVSHRPIWLDMLARRYSTTAFHISRVPVLPNQDLNTFRERAFLPEQPYLIKHGSGSGRDISASEENGDGSLPAINRWFESGNLTSYLDQFAMTFFPYEIMCPPQSTNGRDAPDALATFCSWLAINSADGSLRKDLAELLKHQCFSATTDGSPLPEQRLVQLYAPLSLLIEALRYNREIIAAKTETSMPVLTQLYIAQASLSDLPAELQDDLPTPYLVRHSGRGDIYGTSLWMGLEPTYTPWHRDPNPNLFCQLCSAKIVRLAPPATGERIFRQVQAKLARSAASAAGSAAHSRIRGEEMMQGPERQPLHDAIWAESAIAVDEATPSPIQEARLVPGDMLFIPKGWWHSVKSAYTDGRLNASVNWWYR